MDVMPRAANQRDGKSQGEVAGKNGPDVIALLKKDHAEVKSLFKQFEKAEDGDKAQIARDICQLLTVHAICEEELVYPAAREVLDDDTLIPEAEIEHETAKSLIEQIEDATPGDERFDALVTVLGEYIGHHVSEEENEIFPKLQSKLDVRDLGAEVEARKAELTAELEMDEEDDEEEEEDEDEDDDEDEDEDDDDDPADRGR
jgi:hemerythrin superfamily protein